MEKTLNLKLETLGEAEARNIKLQPQKPASRNLCVELGSLLALALALAGPSAQAANKPVRLKLGTLAPAGTSYHKSLLSMGEKWRKLSNETVQLTVFPGGTQGSEADMVGLMQTRNLDAGL